MLNIKPAKVTIKDIEYELHPARIDSTMLGIEDHGIFTFNLTLDYGGSFQGAGGWSLDAYDQSLNKRIGAAFGISVIIEILRIAGVDEWEKLKGQHILAVKEPGWGGYIRGISNRAGTKHLMFDDMINLPYWSEDASTK
jgi:hypothetical protein